MELVIQRQIENRQSDVVFERMDGQGHKGETQRRNIRAEHKGSRTTVKKYVAAYRSGCEHRLRLPEDEAAARQRDRKS